MSDENVGTSEMSQSRRRFMAAAASLGAGAFAGFGLSSTANGADKTQSSLDPATLAASNLTLSGSQAEFEAAFRSILLHENAHVVFLAQTLGASARPKPTFQNLKQTSMTSFIDLATAFENTGAGAYLNAAPAIFDKGNRYAAASIALVEGRHAGFLNVATSMPITKNDASFEQALGPAAVMSAVAPYIKSLNGGPPLTYSATASPTNDVAIFNFALALE